MIFTDAARQTEKTARKISDATRTKEEKILLYSESLVFFLRPLR
jgi:hypothetical protein